MGIELARISHDAHTQKKFLLHMAIRLYKVILSLPAFFCGGGVD